MKKEKDESIFQKIFFSRKNLIFSSNEKFFPKKRFSTKEALL